MKLRIYNKTLDPALWDENKKLNPDVRESLLKTAQDFYKSTDFVSDIQEILLLGSSVNYNWTPYSDIDVHIVIDIAEEKINLDYARKFMDTLAAKWNTDHDINVKGKKVEVYLQDIREPNASAASARKSAAIYSLMEDKWVLEPKREDIEIDKEVITKKYTQIVQKINKITQEENVDRLKELMKSIRNYRDAGLTKGGEFSTENIVFKALRHTGMLKKLKDTITNLYDRKVSINEDFVKSNLYAGVVDKDNNYKVYAIPLVDEDENDRGHDTLYRRMGLMPSYSIYRFRYRKDLGIVYWWEGPDDAAVYAVDDWIRGKFNKMHVDHHKSARLNNKDVIDAHTLTENVVNKFFVVGFITGDLKIFARKTGGQIGHADLVKIYGLAALDYHSGTTLHWRYNSTTNTIYWWQSPSDKQKFVVKDYLEKEFRVSNPTDSVGNKNSYMDAGHILREKLMEKVMELMWKNIIKK